MAEVVKKQGGALVNASFEEMSGLGFAETTTQDMSIPFLRILGAQSPQVDESDGAYVEGAKGGMLYNTVTNTVTSGKEGMLVVPCYYNRRYVEWKPRTEGGGYVASYLPDDPIVPTAVRNDKNEEVLPNGNLLTNTAQHFVMLVEGDQYSRCLITMSSTQLKKSRRWLSQMNAMTAMGKNGPYTLPMMSQFYTLTTVPEQNDLGKWYGWAIARERQLDLSNDFEKSLFDNAVAFAKSVEAGEVEAKEVSPDPTPEDLPPIKDAPKQTAEVDGDPF
jgi:hypothetical protein|tara:strand:+ start:66 stop:890 length:825 start_codon:yes stop_codon:yes gene_type:complete